MKIFITGVAGFLGSHLADRMISLEHSVSGNDNFLGGYVDNINPLVDFHEVDCCDYDSMVCLMKDVDVVIHAAATAHEGLSVFSPNFITKNVYQASISTISAAIANNVKRFVFCSSMARYGNQEFPFVETQNTSPVDPYGIAKVAVEQTLIMLSNIHGMEWNIAVPHNIIGPRQRYDDPFRNVVSIMINRNLQGKEAIVYGDGFQKRCFSYIDDCVFCLEKLALGNIVGEIINIGPDEESVTINELVDLIAKECNFHSTPTHFLNRPAEVKNAICSSKKARDYLGYRTTTSLAESITKTAEWIRHRGTKQTDYSFPLEIVNDKTPIPWKDRLM
jgi:UDP-glucose 4-epimerase